MGEGRHNQLLGNTTTAKLTGTFKGTGKTPNHILSSKDPYNLKWVSFNVPTLTIATIE